MRDVGWERGAGKRYVVVGAGDRDWFALVTRPTIENRASGMSTRQELHEAVDRLDESKLGDALVIVQNMLETDGDAMRRRLKALPGVKLPDQWPPTFAAFEPIQVEGEPVSEQLIRECR